MRGRPIATPFGTVYSTNITPDEATGVGGWSEEAFVRAVREGVSQDGHHLYPVFPYDHMTKMREDDIKAVYAFIMTRRPANASAPANALPFPFNFRPLLAGWKLLFLHRGPAPVPPPGAGATSPLPAPVRCCSPSSRADQAGPGPNRSGVEAGTRHEPLGSYRTV